MISVAFQNLAFPWLFMSLNGEVIDQGGGSLFELDPTAAEGKSFDFIKSIRKTGWYTCPMGWAVYARQFEGNILILPGLKVKEKSKIIGSSPFLQIKLSSDYVESHVERIISNHEKITENSSQTVRSLIHEIRGVNAAMKNAAYELNHASSALPIDSKRQTSLSGNILALSEILSARMDTQDVVSAFEAVKSRPKERIFVYKKFDKIIRSFRPTVQQRRIQINLNGESHKRVFGPDMFEIVPFLMVENAVKYSLDGNEINCSIEEELYHINCTVESFGPQIAADEKEKIFTPGFRGKYAQQSGVPGDGLGLAILKRTVEGLYNGKIEVEVVQERPPVSVDGVLYCLNTFICRLPIAL